jgi:hypothetical protein
MLSQSREEVMFRKKNTQEPLPGRRLALLRFYFDSLILRGTPILEFTLAAARVGKRDAELAVMFRDYSNRRSRRQQSVYEGTLAQLGDDVAEWHRVTRDVFVPWCVSKEADSKQITEGLFEGRPDPHDLLLLRYVYEVESDSDVMLRFHERWMAMLSDDVGQVEADLWLKGAPDPLPILKKMTASAREMAERHAEVMKQHPYLV